MLLLVGEAPGRGEGKPLEGAIGLRLSALFGLSLEEYLAKTERMNLLDRFPGLQGGGKGTLFPKKAAMAAYELKWRELSHKRVIFLGKRVAEVCGVDIMEYLYWQRYGGGEAAIIPHPSGIVQWWNDPDNELAAREFLTKALLR